MTTKNLKINFTAKEVDQKLFLMVTKKSGSCVYMILQVYPDKQQAARM